MRERTFLAARHAFLFSDPIELTLKGKQEPVVARRVVSRVSEPARGVPGLTSPLVGRSAELQALWGQLDEVLETGRPRLVTILGPAGVGKSRLVQEFVAGVRTRQPNARILRGRCLAAGHGITYWALGEILRAASDMRLDDPSAVAVAKLRATIPDERTVEALAATSGISDSMSAQPSSVSAASSSASREAPSARLGRQREATQTTARRNARREPELPL